MNSKELSAEHLKAAHEWLEKEMLRPRPRLVLTPAELAYAIKIGLIEEAPENSAAPPS